MADKLGISGDTVHYRAREGEWPAGAVLDFGNGLRCYRLDLIALTRSPEQTVLVGVPGGHRQAPQKAPPASASGRRRHRRAAI